MSRVYVAREEALGRHVVVKLLTPELAAGVTAERFTREIRLAAALQEPHIVPVLTAGLTAEGLPWYTLPFVTGESLRARLEHARTGTGTGSGTGSSGGPGRCGRVRAWPGPEPRPPGVSRVGARGGCVRRRRHDEPSPCPRSVLAHERLVVPQRGVDHGNDFGGADVA